MIDLLKKGKDVDKNKKPVVADEKLKANKKDTQDAIPIKEIKQVAYLDNDAFVSAIEIEPVNLSLMSLKEQFKLIKGFANELNTFYHNVKWVVCGRPVDLNEYISYLNRKKNSTTNLIKRRLLAMDIEEAVGISNSIDSMEKKYIVYLYESGKDGLRLLEEKTNDYMSKLKESQLVCNRVVGKDLFDAISLFTLPKQAEKNRYHNVYSTWEGADYDKD